MLSKCLHPNINACARPPDATTVRLAWLERVSAAAKAEDLVRALPDPPNRVLRSTVDKTVFRALVDLADRCADAGIPLAALREALAEAADDLEALTPPVTLDTLRALRETDAVTAAQDAVCGLQTCAPCAHVGREEYCPAIQAALREARAALDAGPGRIEVPDALEIHLEITTRKRLPAVWESGGAISDRSGAATLVAHPDGNPKRPTWVTRGPDACGNHSLFVVNEGDLVCKAWRSGEAVGIGIYEITLIDGESALLEARHRCTGGAWDRTPPQHLLPLVRAAKAKVACLHCSDTHWAATL